jgi:flagellar biosynthetic protein FliR
MNLAVIPETAAAFMIAFARIGTLVMLMPGIGERLISVRIRLTIAVLLTMVLLPVIRPTLTLPGPDAAPALVMLLVSEIGIGLVIGFSVRMIVASLQTAGTIIAQNLNLSFAMAVDPALGTQNVTIANFLALLGTAMVFATDLHHLAIVGIHDSYQMMPPGRLPPSSDAAMLVLSSLARGFVISVQVAAPFIAFGILFNLALGLLARLMPQIQVFFISIPASILLGMVLLAATIGVMMAVYVGALRGFLGELVVTR